MGSEMTPAVVPLVACRSSRFDDEAVVCRIRVPSGVIVKPVTYGSLDAVAMTAFVLVSTIVSDPIEAAKTREPSGLIASKVGARCMGMDAVTPAGSAPPGVGLCTPLQAARAHAMSEAEKARTGMRYHAGRPTVEAPGQRPGRPRRDDSRTPLRL